MTDRVAAPAFAELLTPEEMYRADALAAGAGVKSIDLMERAGAAVASELARRFKSGSIAVLCGPGNNGGDGFVAARHLQRRRRSVRLFLLGDRKALSGDAALNSKRWDGRIEDMAGFAALLQSRSKPAVIVDALFGAGLSREFPQPLADLLNGSGVPIIAIDVPSGLDGLTGKPRGAAVQASVTVTFFRKKPGHVLLPGRALCGEVVVADIGIPPSVLGEIKPSLAENARPALPELEIDTHKYRRGHALIISGPRFNTGAARLAALAAQRAGAGLVTIAGDEAALAVHANHVSSIMLREAGHARDVERVLEDRRIKSVCLGPAAGVGSNTMAKVAAVLAGEAATVLDADALTSFHQNPEQLFDLIRPRSIEPSVVLTPHEGEFERLFKGLKLGSESRIEVARKAARLSGAILLLKGADSVIASPDGRVSINTNAPPSLAMAGSGDVLAGLVAGLLAQGMSAFEAACAGVWLHGNTAEHLPRRGLVAEDLIRNLRFD